MSWDIIKIPLILIITVIEFRRVSTYECMF